MINSNLTSLGDQVQAMVVPHEDIIAFVLIRADGVAEYRSPLEPAQLKKLLMEVSDAF